MNNRKQEVLFLFVIIKKPQLRTVKQRKQSDKMFVPFVSWMDGGGGGREQDGKGMKLHGTHKISINSASTPTHV